MERLIKDQRELARWVRDTIGPVDIAVAFWGHDAVEQLGLDQPGRKFRILLDLLSGATNPKTVRKLLEIDRNSVRCVHRLHAKAYISSHEVVIGSTNASANGLGVEGTEATRWHELALRTANTSVVEDTARWFQQHWERAERVDLDGELLKDAEQAWEANRKRRPVPVSNGRSLIQAAIEDPEAFRGLGWHVAIDLAELDKEDKKTIRRMERELGHPLYAWTGWPDIPEHARLICFNRFEGERFQLDVQRGSPEGVYYAADRSRSRFKFATASYIPGFRKKIGPLKQWLPLLKEAELKHKTWKQDKGLCMDLGEFVEMYGNVARQD